MRSPRWAFVAVSSLLLSGTLTAAGAPAKGKPAPPKEVVVNLAQSSNAFGFDLYQRLRTDPGNLVFSPPSITTVLTMAWGGAEGETAAQMRKVLHLEGTAGDVMAASGRLARSLQDPSRPLLFRIATQIFAQKTYKLVPAYVEKTRAALGAPIETLDFKTAPDRARVHINQWIESKTAHRIQNLIPPDGVSSYSRLVLVNAIYFLGDWSSPFEPWATRPAPFFLTATQKKNVPTMNQENQFLVGQQDGVTAVSLPYKGGEMSMVLLVPDRVDGLAAVEGSLDAKKLAALMSAMKVEVIELSLPKFEINPGGSLLLGGDLRALGMPLAFDRERADLTGIANPPRRDERLFLSEVFHKAFVRVDEKGTEAAAATAGGVPGGMGAGPGPRQIKVDRPFLFLIRDNASGLVVFLGRVSDPSRR
ncbi:MAG: serpin family protein [Thermoanaerobaculia bacterium]